MAKKLYSEVYRAINKAITPEFDQWAKKNHGISGKKLLAKVASAEGGGTSKNPNTSSAGAKGPFQFIPSTRASYKSKYGVDAWKDDVSATKAAMIHLKGTGVAGYNPGMSSYTDLVLGQDVDTGPLKTGGYGKGGGEGGSHMEGGDLKGKTVRTPGVDRSSERQALKQSYLSRTPGKMPNQSALLEMAGGLQDLQDEPGSSSIKLSRTPRRRVNDGGGKRGVRVPRGGKVTGRPLDRPGVQTDKHVTELVRRASAWSGMPIQLGTGSAHKKISASGNVSAHWGGKAIDLPVGNDTKKGERVAGAILVQLGVPRKQARKLAQKGTPYTKFKKGKRQVQVLWKTDKDHHDHVHVGFS